LNKCGEYIVNRIRGLGFLAVLLLPVLSGCVTTSQTQQFNKEIVRIRENNRLMEEENRRLAGSIETLELELETLQRDQHTFRMEMEDYIRSGNRTSGGRIDALERRVDEGMQQREKDKKEIVSILSKKMAKLMQDSGGARHAPPGKKRSSRSEFGYEHVVQPGETLSEIASAYGVSIAVLIRENGLKNPDQLKVGQKLFVPE